MRKDEINTEENTSNEVTYAHVLGWGIDADPENDPTFPLRNRKEDHHAGMDWERPELQQTDEEILISVERPGLPAVFGPLVPPKGVSGMLRRMAFKYSESDYRHWLPLILADKIGVYEGLADDLKRGHFPNILAERGWKAEWKYNRKNAVLKIALVTGVAAVAVTALTMNAKSKKR